MASVARLRSMNFTSKAQREREMRCAGVNKLYCAQEFLPGASLTYDFRKDTMHLFWCGISRHEAYWLLDDMIPECFDWEQLNEQRKCLPKGHGIPELVDPHKDGKSKCSTSMILKAVQMMHFVLYR